jgi:hypothetical protein
MSDILCVRINWNHTALDQRAARYFYTAHIEPSARYPVGQKGLVLDSMWRQLTQPAATGMLLLDGDVAIDDTDYRAMLAAIDVEPDIVHTAPVKLWPVSTKREDWIWAHWRDEPGQYMQHDPLWFSFCFTYLPRALIEKAHAEGFTTWCYPYVDAQMSRVCQESGIRASVVSGCWPKHLNT